MRYLEILFGVFLLIMLLAAALLGLNYFRSREYIEPHIVITGPGVDGYATGNVTLSLELYDDDIAWITITSSLGNDAPIPMSYNPITRSLSIYGLVETNTRTLTITYRYNQLASYYGADLASEIIPALLVLSIIGLIGVSVYGIWPRRGGG